MAHPSPAVSGAAPAELPPTAFATKRLGPRFGGTTFAARAARAGRAARASWRVARTRRFPLRHAVDHQSFSENPWDLNVMILMGLDE